MKKYAYLISVFLFIFLLAACSNGTKEVTKENKSKSESSTTDKESKNDRLQLLENDKIGKYLADSKGMALYYFAKDQPGVTNCSGECLMNWPAFPAQYFEVPDGFNKSDFGTIKRADDGTEQVTYKGYPLYYFIKDKSKGDVTGQAVGDVWFIINAETSF
ncbi:hypothetical protein [Bacillus sp. ISL-7]|uniref:COG4315 family predicted lipoprotein n=1 Tax=Bacillus sp. ISL-7 TaxID=2819136 RepID=UPI001BE7E734|nr:hypothetical protein [Bacillus sp. ISL-7]MBT2736430.1 hypothetical protein [Bacillus sp. ISL-7]